MSNLLKKEKGFTLIEIVLVLAIAGLLLVVVFLAVSGAQKSRRDSARKDAASRLLAAAESAASNSNGTYPTNCAAIGSSYNPGLGSGNYACTDAATTIDNVQYIPGTACDGSTSAKYISVKSLQETGGATYCVDNK